MSANGPNFFWFFLGGHPWVFLAVDAFAVYYWAMMFANAFGPYWRGESKWQYWPWQWWRG